MHHLRSTTADPIPRAASGKPTGGRLPTDPLAYTLSAATAACGLSRSTLYRHAATGRLRLVKVGGRTLVDAASLRALVGAAT